MSSPSRTTTHPDSNAIIEFWRDAGPSRWFASNALFDAEFRSRFLEQHEAARQGECNDWLGDAFGALALVILLDQFPRNAFRGTARMYSTDVQARRVAEQAIKAGFDARIPAELRLFFYLPFAHSEDLADQDKSLRLSIALGPEYIKHAQEHHDIIRRFGRFPHRNKLLDRTPTEEEKRFLEEGGFAG
ncbi:MAG: DUF924 family protein [Thiobacillaceae bacterium]